MNRRSFIDFLVEGVLVAFIVPSLLSSCTGGGEFLVESTQGLTAQVSDDVQLVEGLQMEILIRYEDPISASSSFGYNNDGIVFLPDLKMLWVSHPSINPRLKRNYDPDKARLRSEILGEMLDVGGSLMKVKKGWANWSVLSDRDENHRLTGSQAIPFLWHEQVAGAESSFGTVGNGAASLTPWGTILLTEEYFSLFYGDRDFATGTYLASELQWEVFYPKNRTEHYGWIVEFDPITKEAKKHVAPGRMARGSTTIQSMEDGRAVIYSGDKANGGCLYKFVGAEAGSLAEGQLFVGNFSTGQWEPISWDRPELQQAFQSETDMMIHTREAGLIVGGSPLDQPAHVSVDPRDGTLLVSLTKNLEEENYMGSIMRITESDNYDGERFGYETFLTGGEEAGFACPDDMTFDAQGNLWFTSEVDPRQMDEAHYRVFGNNGLFVVPTEGVRAGQVIRMANAPVDANFAGPCFGPDGTLFLSVKNPGATSEGPQALTSQWPDGSGSIPTPAVIAISGSDAL